MRRAVLGARVEVIAVNEMKINAVEQADLQIERRDIPRPHPHAFRLVPGGIAKSISS